MTAAGRDTVRATSWAAPLGSVYFLLAYAAVSISSQSGDVAFVWPANALAVALLARLPARATPRLLAVVAVANVLANLLGGQPWPVNLGATAGNLVEIAVGAWLVRLWVDPQRTRMDLDRSMRALVATCIVATAVGGALGSAAIAVSTAAHWNGVFVSWVMGDIAGYCLLLVPALAVRRTDVDGMLRPRMLAAMVLQAAVICATVVVGWQIVRFPFVLIAVPTT